MAVFLAPGAIPTLEQHLEPGIGIERFERQGYDSLLS
jgi:hypothetical protein